MRNDNATDKIVTTYVSLVDLQVPMIVGTGWGASVKTLTLAKEGQKIVVTTFQTPAPVKQDDEVILYFEKGEPVCLSFEHIGLYVASGAIKQIGDPEVIKSGQERYEVKDFNPFPKPGESAR